MGGAAKKKKERRKKSKLVLAFWGGTSSSCPFGFLEDSGKGHKASWRKGEETVAKRLKEGRDAGGFAIEEEEGEKV